MKTSKSQATVSSIPDMLFNANAFTPDMLVKWADCLGSIDFRLLYQTALPLAKKMAGQERIEYLLKGYMPI